MVAEIPLPAAVLHDFTSQVPASSVFHNSQFGGLIAEYGVATEANELITAVRGAISRNRKFRVIGGGESLLIPDTGYDGLIIKNASKSFHLVPDLSQVIVDTGMPLRSFIMQLVASGYGGLIHLLPLGGTVGGALVTGAAVNGRSLIELTRSLTVLMPPTKTKPEVRVVRFQGSWLQANRSTAGTRILDLLRGKPDEPAPVIISAQLQLTSLRSDELERQVRKMESYLREIGLSANMTEMGPLVTAPDGDIVMMKNLQSLQVIEKKYDVSLSRSGVTRAVRKRKPLFKPQTKLSVESFYAFENDLAEALRVDGMEVIPAHELVH